MVRNGKLSLVELACSPAVFRGGIVGIQGASGFFHVGVRRPLGKFQRNFPIWTPPSGPSAVVNTAEGASAFWKTHVIARNVQMILRRLPKNSGSLSVINSGAGYRRARYLPRADAVPAGDGIGPTCSPRNVYGATTTSLGFSFHSRPTWTARLSGSGLRTGSSRSATKRNVMNARRLSCQFLMELVWFSLSSDAGPRRRFFPGVAQARRAVTGCACSGSRTGDVTDIWNNGENRPYPRV